MRKFSNQSESCSQSREKSCSQSREKSVELTRRVILGASRREATLGWEVRRRNILKYVSQRGLRKYGVNLKTLCKPKQFLTGSEYVCLHVVSIIVVISFSLSLSLSHKHNHHNVSNKGVYILINKWYWFFFSVGYNTWWWWCHLYEFTNKLNSVIGNRGLIQRLWRLLTYFHPTFLLSFFIKKNEVGDLSRTWPENSRSNSYYTKV